MSEPSYHPHEIVILVVDDEVVVSQPCAEGSCERGYQVLTAANGEEALELVRTFPDAVHLLLTDVNMPTLDGFKLAKLVRLEKPKIKIMFMSGRWEVPGETFPSNVIMKPFQIRDLVEKVRSVLDERPGGPDAV
jgi:DNA-binding response OmpR family regulator